MKIVHLIDKLTVGGAQKLLVTFARQAAGRDIDITVVVLWANPYSGLVQELESLGVTVRVFPGRRVADIRRLIRLARYFRAQKFDVISTHLFQSNILGPLMGWMTGAPVFATLHNVAPPKGSALRVFVWKRVLRRGCFCVVAVGEAVATAHSDWLGRARQQVLRNPVQHIPPLPSAERARLRSALMGNPDGTLIVSVGIVSLQKAFPDLVEACHHICQPDTRNFLVIAGGGRPHRIAELKSRIRALSLEDRVLLLGMRDDIPELLSAADLFVSSSHWEGLPVAVLEAMSAGLPIVATSVGEVSGVVVEGTGILVPPARPDLLRNAIEQLLDDPERRLSYGRAAREHVAKHHDPRVWLDAQLSLFSEAINRQT